MFTEQELKTEERELLREVYSRIEIFEQACRPFHDAAREVREIVRCRDPHQDAPGEEPTLQLQTLKSTFMNAVADQMLSLPEAKLTSETPAQIEAVDDLQDLLHHIVYDVNDYEAVHRRISEDFHGAGTAIIQVGWDEDLSCGKGDVQIIRWPLEAFLWDPQVEDIQDSRAVIKVGWHPLSWYEAHYPDKAKFVNSEENMYHNVGLAESQFQKESDDEDRAMLVEYWYRRYDAKKNRYTINVAICAGGALLDQQEDVYDHGMYPFVVAAHSTIEGSIAGEGMVTELVPMMRYINKYAKYIDTNLRMGSKARMLTRKNSGINKEDLADWSKDIIEGDSVIQGEDWNWMQHAPLNGMVVNMMNMFQTELKQDSGYNEATRGENAGGSSYVSSKSYLAMQNAGAKVSSMRTAILRNMFRKMAEQVLWMVAQFYDDKRIIMVTGRENNNRQVTMDARRFFGVKGKGAVTPPPYVVRVEVVSKDPTAIGAQNDMLMQAYTMAAQAQQNFPLSALFRLMNIEGKDRLLPVIEASENQMAQMQQMAQQIEQMQGQLEQMQKENSNLRDTATRATNALANVGKQRGMGFQPGAGKVGGAGPVPGTTANIVHQNRAALGGGNADQDAAML